VGRRDGNGYADEAAAAEPPTEETHGLLTGLLKALSRRRGEGESTPETEAHALARNTLEVFEQATSEYRSNKQITDYEARTGETVERTYAYGGELSSSTYVAGDIDAFLGIAGTPGALVTMFVPDPGDLLVGAAVARVNRQLMVPVGRMASKGRATGARMLTGSDWDAAEAAYDTIRAMDDVAAIAANTGMREPWVARIKDHLFFRTHQLDDGVARFDADPYIANAWQRMQAGTHTANDMRLLQHELFESKFEGIFRTDYRTAHDAAISSGRTWEWTP
jgi:hypothetical protein